MQWPIRNIKYTFTLGHCYFGHLLRCCVLVLVCLLFSGPDPSRALHPFCCRKTGGDATFLSFLSLSCVNGCAKSHSVAKPVWSVWQRAQMGWYSSALSVSHTQCVWLRSSIATLREPQRTTYLLSISRSSAFSGAGGGIRRLIFHWINWLLNNTRIIRVRDDSVTVAHGLFYSAAPERSATPRNRIICFSNMNSFCEWQQKYLTIHSNQSVGRQGGRIAVGGGGGYASSTNLLPPSPRVRH